MKIRYRLFISFLILVGLGFYTLVDWITDDLRPRYLATMEESMIDTATILSSFIEQKIKEGAIDVDNMRNAVSTAQRKHFKAKIYEVTKTHLNMQVYISNKEGIIIFDSENGKIEGEDYSRWNDVFLTLRGEYGARSSSKDPDDPSTTILYVAAPIKDNSEIVGVLTVHKRTDSVNLFLSAAQNKIIIGGIFAGLIVVLLGMIISLWITSPIQKLTNYAKAIRDGQRTPIPNLGNSEIGELGDAFEEMRDALEGKQYAENYVQTLTHEMKSPLSAIRGAAELLAEDMSVEQRKQFIDNIRSESDRIQDLVDRLLQLSSLENRKGLRDVEKIDLSALCKEIQESMTPTLSSKHLTITMQSEESVTIRGERFLVRQAISNLMQNAIDFSPENSEIQVYVKSLDSSAEVQVSDQGPGVPEFASDKIFNRFFSLPRPDTGKKSSGLGLTLVHEVASLHGGNIIFSNRPECGADVTLTLPANPSEMIS